MISAEEKSVQKNKLNYFAYGFIIFSLTLTISLFFYNIYLEETIESTGSEISQIDTSIKTLREDKKIQIYNLTQENKKVLADLEKKSKINDFIYHIRSLEQPNGIVFKGFNYNNGNLSSQVVAPFETRKLASNKVSHFIKDYREDKASAFNLGFISTFNGSDSISFGVNLTLK